MLHETGVIQTVAASHVIGMLLSEYAEGRAIGPAYFDPNERGENGSKYSK